MTNEQQLQIYDALKRISLYTPPDKLRRTAGRDYGLEYHEALEMAYENVISEAKAAIRGKRRPEPDAWKIK